MNEKKYLAEVQRLALSYPVDTTLLPKWFDSAVKTLSELHRQKSGISHPRHRGDARETDFLDAVGPMFPESMNLAKGFLVGTGASVSREQDILVLDGNQPTRLMGSGDAVYHMAGAALASIEIKSKLTLPELRKAILNCISAKAVVQGLDEKSEPKQDLWHVVFAYSSQWSFEDTTNRINREIDKVPDHLRPDGVYLLGSGLILPGSKKGLEISHKQSKDIVDEYVPLGPMGTELTGKSEAYPFLWFVESIIAHCLEERANRIDINPFDYFVGPLLMQSDFERKIKEDNPEMFNKWLENRTHRTFHKKG